MQSVSKCEEQVKLTMYTVMAMLRSSQRKKYKAYLLNLLWTCSTNRSINLTSFSWWLSTTLPANDYVARS